MKHYLLVYNIKTKKQEKRYYSTEFEKDKAKRLLKGKYLILEDSSNKYDLD